MLIVLKKEVKKVLKKEDLNVFLRMAWLPKDESLRQALVLIFGADAMPDDTMAWTTKFIKDGIPDVEFFIDEMAKYCARELKRINKFTEENFITNMVFGMNLTVNHELIHWFGDIKNERVVEFITNMMMKDAFMGWKWIPCPNKEKNVTWIECLQCTDSEKAAECPFRMVRIDAAPREYKLGEYHVTELPHVLKAYFERTDPYARAWLEYYDMMFGKALGYYIEGLYEHHCQEVDLRLPFGEREAVVGSADLVLDKTGRLVELKFYYNISKLVRTNTPNVEHTFQAQAYYTMGLKHKPYLFKKIKRITLVYYSKMKSRKVPRRKEFEVELVTIEKVMVERATILHKALVRKIAPIAHKCPTWLCGYCKHVICPFHPKRGDYP